MNNHRTWSKRRWCNKEDGDSGDDSDIVVGGDYNNNDFHDNHNNDDSHNDNGEDVDGVDNVVGVLLVKIESTHHDAFDYHLLACDDTNTH